MSKMVFEVKNLNFSYDVEKVLKDINFKMDKKEFLVIVGKSGCGKTTLLRTIAGLEKIHQGSILMHDEDITFNDPKSRDLGYVMQEYPLYPNLSVFENISFGLKNKHLKIDEVEDKVYEVAKLLGIYKILNEKPKHLSGGEKQRVCLAKAMISKPKLLLFDEPLSNLDAQKKIELRTEIQKLYASMDIPFIYVTHDQEEALSLATKIMYMDEGKIVQFDDKENLIVNPKNLKVAEFFSSPKLNLFVGLIKDNFEILIEDKITHHLDPIYFELLKNMKNILVGVKPENIDIDDNGLLEGRVSSIETHGSKYLYEIMYNNQMIFVKSSKELIINSVVRFNLPFDKLLFFDKVNKHLISLYHYINQLPINLKDHHLYLLNKKLDLDNSFLSSIYMSDVNDLFLSIAINSISLESNDDSLKIPVKIDQKYSNSYKHFYKSTIIDTNLSLYFSSNFDLNLNEIKNVYIDKSQLIVTNSSNTVLKTKLPLTKNTAVVSLKSTKDYSKIKLGKKTFKFERINYPDGNYIIQLNPSIEVIEKCENLKVIKKAYQKYLYSNVLLASAYDEDFIDQVHIIYVKVDGFDDYLTLINHNDFSVYNQPELILSLDLDSIKFLSKNS